MVELQLFGQDFMAISAGPLDAFNHAVSFIVNCDDQAEIDRYWSALLQGGGSPEQCGWLKDRYGLGWQIVPGAFGEMMNAPDKAKVRRMTDDRCDADDGEARHREAAGGLRRHG